MPPRISFYTTVLRPDHKLAQTHASLSRAGLEFEHVVSVATGIDDIGKFLPIHEGNLRILSTPGAGISEGFNAAIQACSAPYLMVANAGDQILDIRPLVEALEGDKMVDIAYGDIAVNGKTHSARRGPLTHQQFRLHAMCFCHGAAVTRSSFFQEFGYYDRRYPVAMDFDVFYSAMRAGAVAIHRQTVAAEIEPPGISSNIWKRTKDNYRVIRRDTPRPLALVIASKWLIAAWCAEKVMNRRQAK
jgi:hypothetical protein